MYSHRGVAQFGSARGLGPWGREFESLHPDHFGTSWLRAFSSVGQSSRLITDRSGVQVPEGPPQLLTCSYWLCYIAKISYGLVVQMVRTLACHARGRGFESLPGRHFFASVAQSVEQGTENPRVGGSIPPRSTTFFVDKQQLNMLV